MTKNPTAANGEMTLQEVSALMRDGDFGVLPVVEKETNKLVGILTDRDIVVRAVADGKKCLDGNRQRRDERKTLHGKTRRFCF